MSNDKAQMSNRSQNPNPTDSTNSIVVLITAGSQEEARKIADHLVGQKKAACINIVPGVDSIFRWKGRAESARESLLLVKTSAALLSDVVRLVKELGSYELPEIIALPITGGSEEYLRWLDTATQ
jgi:periplasmic divalent cation tolerance protein